MPTWDRKEKPQKPKGRRLCEHGAEIGVTALTQDLHEPWEAVRNKPGFSLDLLKGCILANILSGAGVWRCCTSPGLVTVHTHSATEWYSPGCPANFWILHYWPPKLTVREEISVVLSHKTCDDLSNHWS